MGFTPKLSHGGTAAAATEKHEPGHGTCQSPPRPEAARRLYLLRLALHARDQATRPGTAPGRQVRRAERRAQAALTRAGFAAPAIAAEVLRHVQVLTLTQVLARLDYTTADAARAAVANLITCQPPSAPDPHVGQTYPQGPALSVSTPVPAAPRTSQPGAALAEDRDRDRQLLAAAARIVAEAAQDGDSLSQAALAGKLRGQG